MKSLYALFLVLLGSFLFASQLHAQLEFNGVLESWANIKQRFGAKGDGVADDTKAIQSAIDSLSVRPVSFNTGERGYTVIYLPKGRYKISSTLHVRGKIGFSIVGEDPVNTVLLWAGAAADTMIWANGSAYFSISRLTFQAGGRKQMTGIGLNWKEKWRTAGSESFASLNIEIQDCRFSGMFWRGIHGGTNPGEGTNANDSEVTIRRCEFSDISEAAISISGFNALDYWIWDCTFLRCFRAVQNNSGNFHVYRSYISKTSNAVFTNTNGYYISVRNCYINGTDRVLYDFGKSSNPFKRIFENNVIESTLGPSIEHYHLGKISFMGNRFGGVEDKKNQFNLIYDSWADGSYELLSVRNRYSLRSPWKINMPRSKVYSYEDSFSSKVSGDTLAFLASMEKTPVIRARKVFEVPRNAGSSQVQSLIDQAAKLRGSRPIIHFPFGQYTFERPVRVPAQADIQFVGDGYIYSSVIRTAPDFSKGESLFSCEGPTKVIFKDLHFENSQGVQADAVQFRKVDQKDSEAYIDQLYSQSEHAIALLGTEELFVQIQNSFFADGNIVRGSKANLSPKEGTGLFSFGASFAKAAVEDNGRLIAKDCWWEGASRKVFVLSGSGILAIDGAMVAPNGADSNVTISIGKFKGKVILNNMYVQGAIDVVAANPDLSLLFWNIHLYHKMNFFTFMNGKEHYKGAFLGMTAQCFNASDRLCKDVVEIPARTIAVDDITDFVGEMIREPMNGYPRKYRMLSPGSSSTYLTRLAIVNFGRAIYFEP